MLRDAAARLRVESEAPWSGERNKCVKAYLTFVALDEKGRTIPLPALEPQTEVEKRRERDAHERRALRLRVRAGVKDAASR